MSNQETDTGPLYECIDCGTRPDDPDGRLCRCGGYLQNIGVSRNL
ncbi:MAG: rubrerythrin-like domain-containing protein [Natronomonas sp.]